MSWEIDRALVNSYRRNIEIGLQQTRSRLESLVRNETQNSEFDFWDRIGPTAAVEATTRHGDTPLIPTPHDRRRVALRDFDWSDLIDRQDRLRMLADPTSAYTRNAVMAFNRVKDDLIIEAAFGPAYTGKTGATVVSFPAGNSIAVNYVETGSAQNSNLTTGKLRRARYLFGKSEVTTDITYDLVCVVDPSQLQALLRDSTVQSSDFNTVKALVNGEIDTWMGFKFVQSNRLPVAGNVRSVLAFEREGLLLASASDVVVDVGPRPDKRNSTQIFVSACFGATRMWEERVLRILCDETL